MSTTEELFNKDLNDLHLIYDYDVLVDGVHESQLSLNLLSLVHQNLLEWKYEMWFFSFNRIVYKIHGGPMAGRSNFQTATYQCIRPGEIWQCNWLGSSLPSLPSHPHPAPRYLSSSNTHTEETGTIVSLVLDIPNKKISTMLGFSKSHWENAKEAHGDKRNPEDLERWRKLARIGIQTDRHMLSEQADIHTVAKGKMDLEPIEEAWPTM
ncbi:phenol acid carboxylase [Venturia nashicola]|nr:phenol acid carboxylase [Venturia nashicola]